MNITIDISKEWFEKNKTQLLKKFNDDEIKYRPEDADKFFRLDYDLGKNQSICIAEDGDIQCSGGDNELYVTITTESDIEGLTNLSQILSKYYNKCKAVFEAIR